MIFFHHFIKVTTETGQAIFAFHRFPVLTIDFFFFFMSAVISPASWREGQKWVKMVLGPVPKLPQDDRSQPHREFSRTGKCYISYY